MESQTIKDWNNHPVTRTLFQQLRELRRGYTNAILARGTLAFDRPLESINELVGRVHLIDEILENSHIKDVPIKEDY